jgi:hypothetical protein
MFLPNVTFDNATAYLLGIDAALHGDFLKGFREWLIPTVGFGNNLPWSELILEIAFSQAEDCRGCLGKPSNEIVAINCLFDCLENFLATKQHDQGLDTILLRYQDWLRSQSWYSAVYLDD